MIIGMPGQMAVLTTNGGGGGGDFSAPAGQIGGSDSNPTIVGITESGGTALSFGAIASGQALVRSGSSIIGQPASYAVYRSVKEFGARGDGTTDDTLALQAAIDAVKTTGGCLYIPVGVYRFTNLNMSRINTGFSTSFTVLGDGPEASILSQTTGATGNAIDISGSNWLHFEGFGLEPGPNSAIGVLAARLTTAQNCNYNTFVRFSVKGSTTKACFVSIGMESSVFDRCMFENGGQTVFYIGSYNKLDAASAFGTIQTALSTTANHVQNCRFLSSLTAPPVWIDEGTGIDFTSCELYTTGANTFPSHVYAEADTTNQSGWMVKFDKCHFEGNGDVFEFANGASPPTNAVYENWVITNNVCINSGYKWITVGGTDVSHTGLIFENNVGPYPVELQDVELSRIYHVQTGATILFSGAANACDIRAPDGGITFAAQTLGCTVSTSSLVSSTAKNFDRYGGTSGQNSRYIQYTAATSAPAAGQLTAGMIAYANPTSWDPASVGGTAPYYAQYDGATWKHMGSSNPSSVGGRILPSFIGPAGRVIPLQPSFSRNRVAMASALGNSTTLSAYGIAVTGLGTATAANVSTASRRALVRQLEYLVTTPATTAVAGVRSSALQFWRGNAAGLGGFHFVTQWGLATGVAAVLTHRAFTGLRASTSAPTDVAPSGLLSVLGMGWDSGDVNCSFYHSDGTGPATKINLGASFPRPLTDRAALFELAMYCAPNGSSVSYEVTNVETGAVATGSVSANIPAATTLLAPNSYVSAGGTLSAIGYTLAHMYIETDF